MEYRITIKGRNGQILFFDRKDENQLQWIVNLLPDHIKNDLHTHERCGIVHEYSVSRLEAVLRVEPYEWTAEQIGEFLCLCYDSYYRRRYRCTGSQSEYSTTGI